MRWIHPEADCSEGSELSSPPRSCLGSVPYRRTFRSGPDLLQPESNSSVWVVLVALLWVARPKTRWRFCVSGQRWSVWINGSWPSFRSTRTWGQDTAPTSFCKGVRPVASPHLGPPCVCASLTCPSDGVCPAWCRHGSVHRRSFDEANGKASAGIRRVKPTRPDTQSHKSEKRPRGRRQ